MSEARNVSAWNVLSGDAELLAAGEVRRGGRRGRPPSRRAPRCTRRSGRSSRIRSIATEASAAGAERLGRGVGERHPGGAAAVVGGDSRRASSPDASPATTNSPVLARLAAAALTTSTSARAPCGTGSLTPDSVQASPDDGRRDRRRGVLPARPRLGVREGQHATSLGGSAPSSDDFCSSEPAAATRPPASTTEVRNGSGASTRPSSWATMPTSTGPAPDAAVLLGERQPEDAHLGQPLPQLLVEARVLGHGAGAASRSRRTPCRPGRAPPRAVPSARSS